MVKHRQEFLFPDFEIIGGRRKYLPILTSTVNRKGVLDVDTVKGCAHGLDAYPDGGCYGECYAMKIANTYGIDFKTSVSRKPTRDNFYNVYQAVKNFPASWYRIGTAGDPSHDWDNTVSVCESLSGTNKVPVIITKHWVAMNDSHAERLAKVGAVVNTSTSGLDTDNEIGHRLTQIERMCAAGIRSVCRVVTCKYGETEWARGCKEKQDFLLSYKHVIDNPLRARKSNPRVLSGEIIITRQDHAIGGGKMVSLHDDGVFLGSCRNCNDQCGVETKYNRREKDECGAAGFDF